MWVPQKLIELMNTDQKCFPELLNEYCREGNWCHEGDWKVNL